jgi:hypothetical protein
MAALVMMNDALAAVRWMILSTQDGYFDARVTYI